MKYTREILPNKLRVVTIPMPSVESVTVLILVGAGSRYERRDNNGISHFLEHMVYKGTKKRPNPIDIPSEIEGIGGSWNAFTAKDHTGFYIKAAKAHLPHLFDILSDILLHSLLKGEEIEKEKGVIVEEINMYEDTPMQKVGEVYDDLIFGDVPLGWDIAGSPESVRSFTKKTFTDYWQEHYAPNNMVIAVAGGIENATMENAPKKGSVRYLVEKYLGDWKDRKVESYSKAEIVQKEARAKIKFKQTEQAHLCIGVPGYNLSDPDRYKLSVMSTILGGGASSRLFDEVREKRGLAYYCRSSSDQYVDVGHFVTQSGVVLSKIDEAIKVILEQFYVLSTRKRPITKSELARAKELLKGHLILSLEDSRNVAGMYGSDELIEEEITTTEEVIAKIEGVSAEDAQKVAEDLFKTEKLNLAIIGPYRDPERFKSLLKF